MFRLRRDIRFRLLRLYLGLRSGFRLLDSLGSSLYRLQLPRGFLLRGRFFNLDSGRNRVRRNSAHHSSVPWHPYLNRSQLSQRRRILHRRQHLLCCSSQLSQRRRTLLLRQPLLCYSSSKSLLLSSLPPYRMLTVARLIWTVGIRFLRRLVQRLYSQPYPINLHWQFHILLEHHRLHSPRPKLIPLRTLPKAPQQAPASQCQLRPLAFKA